MKQADKASAENKPYIFISYSHQDGDIVRLEIERLRLDGFRLWFDGRIDAGNDWPDEIAKALSGCSQCLVFLSPRAILSRNVKDEIHYAADENKPILAVHLEETKLPSGLKLRIGTHQAILKYRMESKVYAGSVERSLLASCRERSEQRIPTAKRGPKKVEKGEIDEIVKDVLGSLPTGPSRKVVERIVREVLRNKGKLAVEESSTPLGSVLGAMSFSLLGGVLPLALNPVLLAAIRSSLEKRSRTVAVDSSNPDQLTYYECPFGHGQLKLWEEDKRCYECGFPFKPHTVELLKEVKGSRGNPLKVCPFGHGALEKSNGKRLCSKCGFTGKMGAKDRG